MIQKKWRRFRVLKAVYAIALVAFLALCLLVITSLSLDLPFDKGWLIIPAFFGVFPVLVILFILHLCVVCAACPACGKQYHVRNWWFIPVRFTCAHCGASPENRDGAQQPPPRDCSRAADGPTATREV